MTKSTFIVAAACALMLGGCASDDNPVVGQGEGTIALHLDADADVVDAVPAVRASRAPQVPEVSDLALSLTKDDGTFSKKWEHASDFSAEQAFSVGAYTMQASWGNPDDEGFEKPYYFGQEKVIVEEGKQTEVTLTASLANTMVSINYTEAFRNYFSQYSTQLHSEGGDFITFLSDEIRPAYLRPGKVTVTLSITKLNGVSATIEPAEFEALARHHYHLTLDVNNGQNGEAQLAVIFDDTIVSEDVTVDLSDDVLLAPAPVVLAKGFTPDTPVELLELSPASQPLTMTVSAAGSLRSVTLTTQSEALLAKGFPAEIDLMAANASQQALLKTFGLDVKGLWSNPDKMAVIDFTQLFSQISGTGTHSFSLVAKDKLGKVNLPLTLLATTQAIDLNISAVSTAPVEGTSAQITVNTTAPDLSRLTVETYSFGAWSEARITASAPAASARHKAAAVAKDYNLNVAIPAGASDLPVRVKFMGQVKDEATIERTGAILTLESENNVFASYATFKVTHNPKVALSSLHYFIATTTGSYVETTNVAFDTTNDRVTIKGLTGATAYLAKADPSATHTEALAPARFTTENPAQLPNSGMEDWATGSSGSNWATYYPGSTVDGAVWGTNNPMTTSQGSNYAYCRISGTKSDTGRTGKAACISTQGWGSGNTAVGTVEGVAVCKYIDAGLLHLGSSRSARPAGYSDRSGSLETSDLTCGLAFASRPSALNFWYKYSAKNSADHGEVLVEVYDALGRVIASGSRDLSSQSDFTSVSIPLTYTYNCAKATKVYVRFLSTNVANALTKSNSWMNAPRFGNLSTGEYYGSRLYIDDISFTY